MRVEIWSDIVCPWCYIGKRRFETALADFAHADDVEVVWRAFELDPSAPRYREGSLADHVARKYGMNAEQARDEPGAAHRPRGRRRRGVPVRPRRAREHVRRPPARAPGIRPRRAGCDEGAPLAAYLTEGAPIGDPETLVALAAEVGLDRDEAHDVVFGDRYTDDVRAEERDAVSLGITGVPFFVIDRKYGVSGAQASSVFADVLDNAWRESQPQAQLVMTDGDEQCDDESCVI